METPQPRRYFFFAFFPFLRAFFFLTLAVCHEDLAQDAFGCGAARVGFHGKLNRKACKARFAFRRGLLHPLAYLTQSIHLHRTEAVVDLAAGRVLQQGVDQK